jgi:hypothetical protein
MIIRLRVVRRAVPITIHRHRTGTIIMPINIRQQHREAIPARHPMNSLIVRCLSKHCEAAKNLISILHRTIRTIIPINHH